MRPATPPARQYVPDQVERDVLDRALRSGSRVINPPRSTNNLLDRITALERLVAMLMEDRRTGPPR